jgi:hypothetical protein
MGVGWGAAALVAGMAIVVVLGLVLVALAGRPGSVWLPTVAVLLGLGVVAGTAWLVFAPVTYDGPEGTVTCHSPTTADKQKVGYDGACRAPAIQRRWVVFVPLGVVGAAALVALLAPGLRGRDDETDPADEPDAAAQATSPTDEAVTAEAGAVPAEVENRPRPTSAAKPISQTDQPT